ncbi:MAG TPA: hypothetical protein VKX16_08290 [Chloroflexota bacterium]|nr:hypothetical protein [Chloroflexota bacterium]
MIRFVQSPRVAVHPGDFGTASALVHDNVAPFELRIPTVTARDVLSTMTAGFGAVARATWFDASGHVIRVTTTSFDLFVTVQRRR